MLIIYDYYINSFGILGKIQHVGMLKTYETLPPCGRVWYCSKLHHTFTFA